MRHDSWFCRARWTVSLAVVALLPLVAITQDKKPQLHVRKSDEASAISILERVSKAYAECKSYRDTGVTTGNGADALTRYTFTTCFVRPDGFRFELNQREIVWHWRAIIWSDGKQVQTWWDGRPGIEKKESLLFALREFEGVTRHASFSIPMLLLPNAAVEYNFKDVANPLRLDDERVDSIECFCIHGNLMGRVGPQTISLWIEKESYLLRRIDHLIEYKGRHYKRKTVYHPAFNETVTDKMLEFNAPIKR